MGFGIISTDCRFCEKNSQILYNKKDLFRGLFYFEYKLSVDDIYVNVRPNADCKNDKYPAREFDENVCVFLDFLQVFEE